MGAPEAAGPSRAGPSLLAASPPCDRATLVRAEQIRAVYGQLLHTFAATVIGGLLFVVVMFPEIPAQTLVLWVAAQWAAAGLILHAYSSYKRSPPPAHEARRWGVRLVVIMFVLGCAWGSAGIVMFRPDFTPHQFALALGIFLVTIARMSGGLTAFVPTVYALAPATILPLIVRMLIERDLVHVAVAVGGLLVLVLNLYYSRNLSRLIAASFDMRFENVLARQRAEDANRAKSRFLAAASHDLRQPLHTLSLYSAALGLHAPEGVSGEIAAHINKALGSLSALVDSLLDISKLDAGAVQPELQSVSVQPLVERIEADYRPVANAKGLEFRVVAPGFFVETDPVLLERLVRNLVDNAFKYTAAGGVALVAKRSERVGHITVRDTGPGIPASERERIFEEFYQIGNPERDRSEGLGLGLAIVRRLAYLLGLEVMLDSTLGCGSTFTVTMPLARERSTEPRPPAVPAAADSGVLEGARVLVIDDEPEVRAGMRALLGQLGCRVAVCGGYAEAERLLDEKALEPDLIVADFRLRRRENGIDTVHRLRKRLGDVPALLVSGDTAPERLREAQGSGLPLLHKPVSVEKLTEAMLAALRR
jgi:two-component system, sensor histidine kinase